MVGGGSKSAKGGPNPLADMDRGGGQIRGGSKSAVTEQSDWLILVFDPLN